MPRHPRIRSALYLVLALAAASRSAPAWNAIDAPATGRVTAIAGSGGVLIAGTNSGFLYRSEDGGGHWTRTGDMPAYPVLSILAEGSDAFAVRSEFYNPLYDCWNACGYPPGPMDVATSRDTGKTWAYANAGSATALARHKDGTVWGFSKDFVLRLDSGGTAWKSQAYRWKTAPASPGGSYANCKAAAAFGPWVFAILNDRLYYADTRGGRDALVFTKASDSVAYGLTADSAHAVTALSSGFFWLDNPVFPTRVRGDKLSWLGRGEPGLLALSADGKQILRSLDHGQYWVPVGLPNADTARAAVLQGKKAAVLDRRTAQVWAADTGAEWLRSMEGIRETAVTPMLVANGAVVAKTYAGTLQAPLAGGAWTPFSGPPDTGWSGLQHGAGTIWAYRPGLWSGPTAIRPTWNRFVSADVYAFAEGGGRVAAAFDAGPNLDHVLVICDGPYKCRETRPGLLGRSYQMWMMSNVININRLASLAVDGDAIWAADSVLHRSIDAGATWDTAYAWNEGRVSALYAFRGALYMAGAGIFGCGDCMSRSTDLGTTWTRVVVKGMRTESNAGRPIQLGGRLYTLDDAKVYGSEDGESFADLGFPGARPPTALQGDATAIAVKGADGRIWIGALEPAIVGLAAKPKAPRTLRWSLLRDTRGRAVLANGALAPLR